MMAHKNAIALVSTITGYDISEVNGSDDAMSLDLWDSIAHVNIIIAVEAVIKRPVTTLEVLELSSIMGIQKILDRASEIR